MALQEPDKSFGEWDQLIQRIRSGLLMVQILQQPSAIILRDKEVLVCSLANVFLSEPRSVRESRGIYGGPSIRLAKGLWLKLGKSYSKSESHQELRRIDKGDVILTTERFIFSATMRTVALELKKIVSIDNFDDGIGLQNEGREKKQYFEWQTTRMQCRYKETKL